MPTEQSQEKENITHTAPEPALEPERGGQSRTAIAGRAFVKAIAADLAGLTGRLLQRFRRARKAAPATAAGHGGASGTRRVWRLVRGFAVAAVLGVLAAALLTLWAIRDLPVDNMVAENPARTVILEAANGEPLGRLGSLKIVNATRQDLPDALVKAVVSVEDKRFYSHFGIDPVGIARAIRRNFAAGRIVEGGSTITQQLVKLRLLGSEQTFTRKLREAFAAIWLEMRLGKDDILTAYLNSVYLGAGTYGIPAAARFYFDKAPSELTLAESALLVGMIKAPSRYSPLRDLKQSRQRAGVVLDLMVENGAIDKERAERAKANAASLNRPVAESPPVTWLADWVSEEALKLIRPFRGGARVRTTLDPRYQRIAEMAVRDALAEHGNLDVSQAALVAMRPDGAVVAMVGGRDYEQSEFNRAVQAKRQPGSAFKLFVYMAALRNGYRMDHVIDATAPRIDGWQPENFGGQSHGQVTLAEAFARSINTATVNLALDVGIDQVIAAARELGIRAPLERLPSLALGTKEVSLLELTAAYAGVLTGRAPVRPWGISAFAPQGQDRMMSVTPPGTQKELGPIRASLLHLLRLPVEHGTAQRASLGGFTAGKTGTSQDFRDAWFIGFNAKLIVGVWVGNDDNSPMKRVVGGSVPATIWKTFMTETGVGAERGDQLAALAEQGGYGQAWANVPPAQPGRPPAGEWFDAWASWLRGEAPPLVQPPGYPGRPGEPAMPQQGDPAAPQQAQQAPPGQCDMRACATKYRSFDPLDCTYRPYGGEARVKCEIGPAQPPYGSSVPPPPAVVEQQPYLSQ